MTRLTKKQRAFIDAYLVCWNAAEAARRAGYSERTARSIGSENLTKPDVAAEIEQRIKERVMDTNEALAILGDIARGSMKDVLEFRDGMSLPLVRITPENVHLVKDVEKGQMGVVRVKLEDRQSALDKILRANGAYVNRTEITGADGGDLTIRVVEVVKQDEGETDDDGDSD
jgi:phage terminase small subunit